MVTFRLLSAATVLGVLGLPSIVVALDNGLRLPPMGWSSWYGFQQRISEQMLREMADGMVASGLHSAGYQHIWIDDGWAIGRENKSGSCGPSGPTKPGLDSCKVSSAPLLLWSFSLYSWLL
eukprot:SAG11_NODE_13655_length_645_cov_0.943223_1_plen_121_part_00